MSRRSTGAADLVLVDAQPRDLSPGDVAPVDAEPGDVSIGDADRSDLEPADAQPPDGSPDALPEAGPVDAASDGPAPDMIPVDAGPAPCRVYDPDAPLLDPDPLVFPLESSPNFALASHPDGLGFALYYVVDDDIGRDAEQALALIDPDGERVVAVQQMLTPWGRISDLQVVWSGQNWWVGAIHAPGNINEAVLLIHRFTAAGEPVGEPLSIGPEVDLFKMAPGPAGMGILWRDGRDDMVFQILAEAGAVLQRARWRVSGDSQLGLAALGDDYLLAFYTPMGNALRTAQLQLWRDGALLADRHPVPADLRHALRLTAHEDGYALASEDLVRVPEIAFALHFAAIDAEGMPQPGRNVFEMPGEPVESISDLTWHGPDAGFTVVETDFGEQVVYLYRLLADGTAFMLRRELRDRGAFGDDGTLYRFRASGRGSDIGHAWAVPRVWEIRFGVGPLGGCAPDP